MDERLRSVLVDVTFTSISPPAPLGPRISGITGYLGLPSAVLPGRSGAVVGATAAG